MSADADADAAREIGRRLGLDVRVHVVRVDPGPNFEARARVARRSILGEHAATGHTADDQAETVLLALLRGSGARGLSGMRPGPTKPLLALRRHETVALSRSLGLPVVTDPTNDDPRHRRNRLRHELLPLLSDVADRDVVPLITRTADLLRDDDDTLAAAADVIDPHDADQVAAAAPATARRALRKWLSVDGYPPDRAAIERVLEVASGLHPRTDVGGRRRVVRSKRRLALEHDGQ